MFRNSNGAASGTCVMFVSQLIQQTENTMLVDENVFHFVTIYDKTEFSNKLFMEVDFSVKVSWMEDSFIKIFVDIVLTK